MKVKNKMLCKMLVFSLVVIMFTGVAFVSNGEKAKYTNKEILLMNIENYSYVMEKVNKKFDSDLSFITLEELEEIESKEKDFELELIQNANEYEKQLIEIVTTENKTDDDKYKYDVVKGELTNLSRGKVY